MAEIEWPSVFIQHLVLEHWERLRAKRNDIMEPVRA